MTTLILGEYEMDPDSLLGSGAYGEVYKGVHTASKMAVAVKRINERKVSVAFMEQEVAALRAASGHENVVSLLHHQLRRGFMYLVVELCKAGDMQDYFKDNPVSTVHGGIK